MRFSVKLYVGLISYLFIYCSLFNLAVCIPACVNGGSCTAPNECNCTKEFVGDQCEIPYVGEHVITLFFSVSFVNNEQNKHQMHKWIALVKLPCYYFLNVFFFFFKFSVHACVQEVLTIFHYDQFHWFSRCEDGFPNIFGVYFFYFESLRNYVWFIATLWIIVLSHMLKSHIFQSNVGI